MNKLLSFPWLLLILSCGQPPKKEEPKPEPPKASVVKPASTPTPAPASVAAKSEPASVAASAPSDVPDGSGDFMITPERIGDYKLGEAPKATKVSREEGSDYITVGTDDLKAYYWAATKKVTLCNVFTNNPKFKTKEGLGVGSTFGDFEKAYGTSYVEAATGRIFFPDQYKTFDLSVENMPSEGDKKPSASSKVLSIAIDDCPREPE